MRRREFLQSVAAACGLAVLPVGAAVAAGPPLTASEVPYPYEQAGRAALLEDWRRVDLVLSQNVPRDRVDIEVMNVKWTRIPTLHRWNEPWELVGL